MEMPLLMVSHAMRLVATVYLCNIYAPTYSAGIPICAARSHAFPTVMRAS